MKTVSNHKRVYRQMHNAVISGVCAGVARYFEVDTVWVRAAAVASLFFMPGISVIAYIAAVVLLPRREL
ncbi:PspC domain-containing protein [Alteromonas ponticola]|uniref:PspC domain-containing protein n=1 Tax=Alteromonas aquimaris TaxID=2998417 RepID=A0ABT3PA96_9ALTE|nr:PspC domain-containing protein [Alteromonas aquimaris]MCW8109625.1 PspC domain-containing protein [Alteromonas aquimaris]